MGSKAGQTAYGLLMQRKRAAKNKKRRRMPEPGDKCGARKNSGGVCKQPAGFGTPHYGIGSCVYHAGNTPSHLVSAGNQMLNQLMGEPIEMNPLDALLWCIKIYAGEVEWLSEQLKELQKSTWVEMDYMGQKQLNIWARERISATERLAKASKMAIDAGIAERQVRMAENFGHTIAALVQGILTDLQLSAEQKTVAPVIVRKHLMAIEAHASTDEKETA